jgi:hypothetical protein
MADKRPKQEKKVGRDPNSPSKKRISSLTDVGIGAPLYWELRYETEFKKMLEFQLFDWYIPFSLVYPAIESIIETKITHKVLIIGVGRSEVIEVLYKNGFRDITAIDISPALIHKMQVKYESYSGVEFLVMDAHELTYFDKDSFSIVIDKGCMDSIFCGTDFIESSLQVQREVFRVLKKDCPFLCVSYAPAMARIPYFRRTQWAVDICPLPGGEGITMFYMTKTSDEKLLNKKVAGGEVATMAQSTHIVSKSDQTMNKSSSVRSKANSGSMTVTSSIDMIAHMVDEQADTDI